MTTVILWMLFGVIVGGIAALITPGQRRASSVAVVVALAVLGALLGGFVARALGLSPRDGSPASLATAIAGAIALLAVYFAIFARRRVY